MQVPSRRSQLALMVPTVLLALTLAGCAPTAEPTTAPTTSDSAAPTEPTTDPTTPVPTESFSMPADCTGIFPTTQVDKFAADGIILLAGPGGKYGNELITDATPEMNAGGISCYFGIDNEDPNLLSVTVLVSAVPLDSTNRDSVIADLTAQGLLQATDERGDVTFGVLGVAEGQTTANYNVVAADSWISVISADGGEKAYLAAVKLANIVHSANYN